MNRAKSKRTYRVALRLRDLEHLFVKPDLSPFSKEYCEYSYTSGIEYIADELYAHPPYRAVEATLLLPPEQIRPGLVEETRTAIRDYCRAWANRAHHKVRGQRWRGSQGFLPGLVLMVLLVGASRLVARYEGLNLQIVSEGLLIAGNIVFELPLWAWIIYSWEQHLEQRIYETISEIRLTIKPLPVDDDADKAGDTTVTQVPTKPAARSKISKRQVYESVLPLDDVEHLFRAPEASPFSGRYQAHSYTSGIEYLAHELYANTSFKAVKTTILLPPSSIESDTESRAQAAVRRYCRGRIREIEHDIGAARWRGLRALLAAILALIVFIGTSKALENSETLALQILSEGLSFAGWVALWFPLELLTFNLWQHWLDKEIYVMLRDMELAIRPK